MKLPRLLFASFSLILIAASCSPTAPTPLPKITVTHGLPTVPVYVTSVPDAKAAAKAYLDAWKAEDYAAMYGVITKLSQDALSEEEFTARYKDAAINLTLDKLDYEVLQSLTNPASAQVAYRIDFHTNLLGELQRQMAMNLVLEDGGWKVQWEDGLIMPELKGGNHLSLDIKVPSRGNIYDRNGNAIASQMDVVAMHLNTGELDPNQEGTLLTELSRLTGKTPESIESLYRHAVDAGQNWRVDVGEALSQDVEKRSSVLAGIAGLYMVPYRDRYYADGGVAPHVVGYELKIGPEQLEQYRRRGYTGNEAVGYAGLEEWGEAYLAGVHGASLHVVDPKGQIITMLAEAEPQPADSIYVTLDKDLQLQTQKAIEGFKAAAVVLERDTGRVLAMASSPDFDPNMFTPTNPNFNPNAPADFYNRATQGGYPLGSVFKIITMSAALESGLYTQNSTYDCQYFFTELGGDPLNDWTFEKDQPPSGMLTLPEGLMRSCNPWFYHLGLDLFRQKGADFLAEMARGFGLGKGTGINALGESAGNVQDPEDESQAVAAAIGQYTLLVTPLQVADFIAAVGNNGTMMRPQLIEKIAPLDGGPVFTFKPEQRGTLPVSAENLKIVQDAMRSVIQNNRGTAHTVFASMQMPIYGKTGTAQSDREKPHAWFAAYTDAKREDKPDIAVAVVAEYAGEGSEIAAPIVRRILEIYFYGQPSRLYPWESSYYVTKTPTPLYTDTPTPEMTETPAP